MITPEAKVNNKTYYVLLAVLGLILVSPVIDTKLIPGHDYIFHVSRIEAVAESLKNGIFPVHIYVDQFRFWGSPVGIFYPGLFNYIPSLLKLAGVPTEICYNFYIALIIFLGLFASWYGFTLITRSKQIGLLATTLYISSGYYLFDAFIRNALGELLALSFMPLAIACITHLINKTRVSNKLSVLTIISCTAIIESHVLSTAFIGLFSICYMAIHHNKITIRKIKKLVFFALIIFLINSSFIVPFLVFFKKVPISIDYVNEFAQSGWGPKTLFNFFALWNPLLCIALYVFLTRCIFEKKIPPTLKYKPFSYYIGYFGVGLCFLLLSSSIFPWNFLPPLKELFKTMQFSWRFLGQATIFFSICGGFGLYLLLKKLKLNSKTLIFLSSVVCIYNFIAFTNLTPTHYGNIPEKCYWSRVPFYINSDTDYLYKGININVLLKQGNQYITNARIENWERNLTNIYFTYETDANDVKITLPLVNYPGYIVFNQAGVRVPIAENINHMIVINLPKGTGSITIKYEGLLSFKIANYLSLITSLIIILYLVIQRKRLNKLYKISTPHYAVKRS